MIKPDIANVSPCLFTELRNPISGETIQNCNTQNWGYLGGTVKPYKGGYLGGGTPSPPPTPPGKM